MSQQIPESPSKRTITTIEKQINKTRQFVFGNNSAVALLGIVAVVAMAYVVILAIIRSDRLSVEATVQVRGQSINATGTASAMATAAKATADAVLALTPTATPTPSPTQTPTITPTATRTETPIPTPTPEMAVIAVDQPLARQLILQRVTVYQPAWIGLFLSQNCISRSAESEYVGHSKVDPGTTVDVPVQIHEPQYGRIATLLAEQYALPLTACLLWRQPTEVESSQPIRVRGIPISATFFVAEIGSGQP